MELARAINTDRKSGEAEGPAVSIHQHPMEWNRTGAPCSPKRTWAENGFFECFHNIANLTPTHAKTLIAVSRRSLTTGPDRHNALRKIETAQRKLRRGAVSGAHRIFEIDLPRLTRQQ
jgi:hypothetical protein